MSVLLWASIDLRSDLSRNRLDRHIGPWTDPCPLARFFFWFLFCTPPSKANNRVSLWTLSFGPPSLALSPTRSPLPLVPHHRLTPPLSADCRCSLSPARPLPPSFATCALLPAYVARLLSCPHGLTLDSGLCRRRRRTLGQSAKPRSLLAQII